MSVLIRGGTVVDGTGEPRTRADVLIDGDSITAVGPDLEADVDETVDVGGLVVAPGFIDIHTHYDAQVLWDRDLTPSCWHGVTTVVMGNCGFGIAPTRPTDRDTCVRTLENVEGMSASALEAGITWDFVTFPQYLDLIEASPLRLNVGAMIGHTPLRLYTMGDLAHGPASEADIEHMSEMVEEAMNAGALGFATSRSPNHLGAGGRPVPSFNATDDEIYALAGALSRTGRGVVQVTPGSGFATKELAELAKRSGRPVSWTALLAGSGGRGKTKEILDRTGQLGGEVWPQTACRPVVMQVTMADPYPFAGAPSFQEVMAAEPVERTRFYGDESWRARARVDTDAVWAARWHNVSVQEAAADTSLIGRPIDEIAAERGVHPLDVLIDVSIDNELQTRFKVVIANDDEVELESLLRDPRAVLGLSDAGAHASQLCDACFSTHLLEYWVRERAALDLEFAIWRLTGQAADVFRIPRRGRVAPGNHADLVVFDPATIAVGPMQRVFDLPAGADRLIARSTGIEHVFVNGTAIVSGGRDVDARPGRLLRSGSKGNGSAGSTASERSERT